LVATAMSVLLITIAISVLLATKTSVTETAERVQADQAGRVALEDIMVELHSACFSPSIKPIRAGSESATLIYIDATNEAAQTNTEKGEEAFAKAIKHEVSYSVSAHTLRDTTYAQTGELSSTELAFSATPINHVLAQHIEESWNTAHTARTPVFQYYRFYEPSDSGYEAGHLNPTALTTPLTASSAAAVARVTVAFSVAPESTRHNEKALTPIALEDSAVYRLTPASTIETPNPRPCV
jgi:Tfp pilus assembly protein PilW